MALERIARCRGREVPRTKYYVPSTRRQTAARPPATPHPGSLQIANCGRAEGPTSCVISPKSGDPGLSGTLRLRTRGDRLRWVTYLSLVLRRVWARRLMLLGSLLGATLVTALLVVLPLYEASVAGGGLPVPLRPAPPAPPHRRPGAPRGVAPFRSRRRRRTRPLSHPAPGGDPGADLHRTGRRWAD